MRPPLGTASTHLGPVFALKLNSFKETAHYSRRYINISVSASYRYISIGVLSMSVSVLCRYVSIDVISMSVSVSYRCIIICVISMSVWVSYRCISIGIVSICQYRFLIDISVLVRYRLNIIPQNLTPKSKNATRNKYVVMRFLFWGPQMWFSRPANISVILITRCDEQTVCLRSELKAKPLNQDVNDNKSRKDKRNAVSLPLHASPVQHR